MSSSLQHQLGIWASYSTLTCVWHHISTSATSVALADRFLDLETKHMVVPSLVLSCLDYGNALLYGAKAKDLDPLQSLQNKAVKHNFLCGQACKPITIARQSSLANCKGAYTVQSLHVYLYMLTQLCTRLFIRFYFSQVSSSDRACCQICKRHLNSKCSYW